MQDSGKYFACFCVIRLFLCHSFQLITLVHVFVDKPQKVFVGAYGRYLFWIRVLKKFNVAAFSPLVLLSNIFETIKYAQKKEILRNFQYKKAHADPLRRFRNF